MFFILWDVLSVILYAKDNIPFGKHTRPKWLNECWFGTHKGHLMESGKQKACVLNQEAAFQMVNQHRRGPTVNQHLQRGHSLHLQWNQLFSTMDKEGQDRWLVRYVLEALPSFVRCKKVEDLCLPPAPWILSFPSQRTPLPCPTRNCPVSVLKPAFHAPCSLDSWGPPQITEWMEWLFCASWPIHVSMSGGVQSHTFEVVGEGICSSPRTSDLKSLPIVTQNPWCLQNGQICWSQSFRSLSQCCPSLHQDKNTFKVETVPFLLALFKYRIQGFMQNKHRKQIHFWLRGLDLE